MMLVIVSSCRKSIDEYDATVIEEPPIVLVETSFSGQIVDENGEPVSGADVFVGHNSTITNSKGRFAFNKIAVKKGEILIRAEKDDFFISSTILRNSTTARSFPRLIMLDKGEPKVYNTNSEEPLELENGVKLNFKKHSLRTASGDFFSGNANVFTKTSSPNDRDFVNALPGSLKGVNKDKQAKALAPINLLKIELETEDGQKLEIGEEVDIEIPIPPELLANAPDTISLWVFDLDLGRWLQRDLCEKDHGVYTGTILGTGTYIPCEQYDLVNFETNIFHIDTTPASYLVLDLNARDVTFRERWYSDSDGNFKTTVPKGYILDYTITDICNTVLYESPIGEFNNDVVLAPILLDSIIDTFSFVMTGRLLDCDQNPIDTGLVEVYFQNHFRRVWTDADGYFENEISFSCTDFPEILVMGYDQESKLRSENIIDIEEDIDFGDIIACQEKNDFFKFVFKDEEYEIIPCNFKLGGTSGPDFNTRSKYIRSYNEKEYVGLIIKNDIQYQNTAPKPAIFWSDSLGVGSVFPSLQTQDFDMIVTITEENANFIAGTFTGFVQEDGESGSFPVTGEFKARK